MVGIHDNSLSEHLQKEAKLILDKVKCLIRQREAVREQQEALREPTKEHSSLDAVRKPPPSRKLPPLPPTSSRSLPPQTFQLCRQCGQGPHPRQSCPAGDATCFHCNQRGHFSFQCLSTTATKHPQGLNELITVEPLNPTHNVYLDTVNSAENNTWEITIEIQSKPITF